MEIIEKNTKIYGEGKDIAYINGKYYLVSKNPAKICVSEDLNTWTEYNLNSNYLLPVHLAYGNGTFIITGDGIKGLENTYFYYSNDGVVWTPKIITAVTSHTSNTFNTCKFVNNRFVGVSTFSFKIQYPNQPLKYETVNYYYESKNGIDWVMHKHDYFDVNANACIMDLNYHNGLYVAVGNNGAIFTSTDLNNWIKRDSRVSSKLVGISYGKGQFVVVGDNGIILTSSDGIIWTKQSSGTDSYLIRSRYANGMYIVVGYNATILQSSDGINWKNISEKKNGLRFGLTYDNNLSRFVITAARYANGTIPIFYFDTSREITDTKEDSSIFFFNKDLEMLGIVDSFISLRWHRKYFEAGNFEITLPVTPYIMEFLNIDVLVLKNNYTEAGIIETIEFSDDSDNEEVTISGRFLSCLLERRIIKSKINFSGNTIEGMNTIVDSMTPLTDKWETSQVTMSSKRIVFQVTYKNVYIYLCRLSEYSNLGFRIVPNVDSKVYLFEVWAGVDRSDSQNINEQYSFSDDNFNIEKGSLIISNKTMANYALVGGQGEDSARITVEVSKGATGFDLHEVFSDQKSLSNSDVSADTYKQMLKDVGTSKLNDGTFKFEVTATDMDNYKIKWNLGDIVNIKKEKWNVCASYRIVEVEEIIEDGKKTIYPTFGSPLARAWVDD